MGQRDRSGKLRLLGRYRSGFNQFSQKNVRRRRKEFDSQFFTGNLTDDPVRRNNGSVYAAMDTVYPIADERERDIEKRGCFNYAHILSDI